MRSPSWVFMIAIIILNSAVRGALAGSELHRLESRRTITNRSAPGTRGAERMLPRGASATETAGER